MRLGPDIPPCPHVHPEHPLYLLLAHEPGAAAHSRYNALIRRLVSFERAAERELSRARAAGITDDER